MKNSEKLIFHFSIFHSIFHFAIFHSIFHFAGQAPWAQKVGAAPLQGQPEIRSAAIGFDGTAVGDRVSPWEAERLCQGN